MRWVNRLLGSHEEHRFDKKPLTLARNLHLNDMNDGGLLGKKSKRYREMWGKYYQITNMEHYSVSHKADGIRKLLLIDKNYGVWLIMSPGEASCIWTPSDLPENVSTRTEIYEVEMLRGDQLQSGIQTDNNLMLSDISYYLLAYDCLVFDGKKDIQYAPYYERHGKIEELINTLPEFLSNNNAPLDSNQTNNIDLAKVNFLKNNLIYVSAKTRRDCGDPETFYNNVNELLNAQKNGSIPYKTDGLIFTPTFTPYNPYFDTAYDLPKDLAAKISLPKISERNLALYPEVCKWKTDITIDFKIKLSGHGLIELYSHISAKSLLFKEKNTSEILFVGNEFDTFPGKQKWDRNEPVQNNTVWEFSYDLDTKQFRSVRPRFDKVHPNDIDVALDNWKQIHTMISENTIRGFNTKLTTEYHKSIKRYLLRKNHEQANYNETGREIVFLDIGAGVGGDLHLIKDNFTGNNRFAIKYQMRILVENDRKKYPELIRRIKTYPSYKDKIFIITKFEGRGYPFNPFSDELDDGYESVGGEDYETIIDVVNQLNVRVDIVSMMLSMSFFWSSKDMLIRLSKTINGVIHSNARIVYLTLDGNLVKQAFDPAIRGLGYFSGLVKTDTNQLVHNDGKILYISNENGDRGYLQYVKSENPNEPSYLNTYVPNTIISYDDRIQKEWLPRITDLISLIPNSSLSLSYRTDKKYFLSPFDAIFSKLFSYGIIQIRGSKIDLRPRVESQLSILSSSVTQMNDRLIGYLEQPDRYPILQIVNVDISKINKQLFVRHPKELSIIGGLQPVFPSSVPSIGNSWFS
jgi:hypothetical protein